MLSNGLRSSCLLIGSRGITDRGTAIKHFCAIPGREGIEPAQRCQLPQDEPNFPGHICRRFGLHGHHPSPGTQLIEAGEPSGCGAGRRRGLEVGQCPRHRRLPIALETAVISTHDWTHSHLPSQGEPTPSGDSHLLAWSLVVSGSSHNRTPTTGQGFLRKPSYVPSRQGRSRPRECSPTAEVTFDAVANRTGRGGGRRDQHLGAVAAVTAHVLDSPFAVPGEPLR